MADETLPTPQASNDIYLPYMFPMRNYYRELAYPQDGVRPIDLWHEKPFYGRIDTSGRPVYVSETNLKSLPYSVKPLHVIDFVADAYKDFVEDINVSLRFNNFSNTSFLRTINPWYAWTSFHTLYLNHFSKIHDTFVDVYLSYGDRNNKVRDFHNYMESFMAYARSSTDEIPFTKTAFLLSKLFPPTATGLMIDLEFKDHSRDVLKYDDYIVKAEFDCYRNTAAKFGFFLDKNAPWRLVANIGSAKMQEYMLAYHPEIGKRDLDLLGVYTPNTDQSLTKDSLFNQYYYPVKQFDYHTFKLYMFQSYHSYVARFPFFEKYNEQCSYKERRTIVGQHAKETFIDANIEAEKLVFEGEKTYAAFSEKYNDVYFLPLYLMLRAAEAKVKLSTHKLNYMRRQALLLLKSKGIQHALDFIDEETSKKQVQIYKELDPHNLELTYF